MRIPFTIDSIFEGVSATQNFSAKGQFSAKNCSKCKITLPIEKFMKRGDRDAYRSWCNNCMYEASRKYVKNNKDKAQKWHKDAYKRVRMAVLGHYSNGKIECECCGENKLEFMCLDHINGGGNKHKKELGSAGRNFYQYIKNNDFPEGYRVLCHNCNMSYGLYNYCPHNIIEL